MTESPAHPLDPLTAEEIRQAAAILRRDRGVGPGWRFASIELREPAKDAPGTARREALVVCWDRADGRAYRAVVSLTGDAVTAWQHLPGQQPNMTVDEWHECDQMLRAHPALAQALARRGITDMTRVLTDMWAYGAALVPGRYRGRRIGWCDVWYRGHGRGNPYAHHVTGLHPVVDLNSMTLLDVEDSLAEGAAADEPEVTGEYLPELIGMPLREVKPLRVSQPEGVSFTLDGKQDYDWATQRGWTVVNDNVTNGLGTPVGYKLVPSGTFPPLLGASTPTFRRAEVIGHTLWVTPYREDERWPCGDFPNLSEHDAGLPAWTARDRPIQNTDVVLWYVFGIHHVTRPEDWPVMPCDTVSFWLKPSGFFDRNPALDVPPSPAACD